MLELCFQKSPLVVMMEQDWEWGRLIPSSPPGPLLGRELEELPWWRDTGRVVRDPVLRVPDRTVWGHQGAPAGWHLGRGWA